MVIASTSLTGYPPRGNIYIATEEYMPAGTARRTTRDTRTRTSRNRARDMGLNVKRRGTVLIDEGRERQYAHWSECRILGHNWQHLGAPDADYNAPPGGAHAWFSRCRECGTERTIWFARSGLRTGKPQYRNYPDGYRMRGDDKLDRAEWGTLFIRSHLGGK